MLVGIAYTSYIPTSDLRVILPLALGFPVLIAFGFWEAFSKTKYKLCPPHIFTANYGRDFTFPFIVTIIIGMFYFGINIIYPTMATVLWSPPGTSVSTQLLLTLPSNLGLCAGVTILTIFGSTFSRLMGFRWSVMAAIGLMIIFGGVMTLVTPFNKGLMIAATTLQQIFYAYSVIAAISLMLWGIPARDIGIGTGLAGSGRNLGGSFAQAIYTTILVNTQTSRMRSTLPKAAMEAGLSAAHAQELLTVWAKGLEARMAVPGVNAKILEAADLAYRWSYCHGLRIVGLVSLAFGITAFFLCLVCADPEPKMTEKIDVFLENDTQAAKNEFH